MARDGRRSGRGTRRGFLRLVALGAGGVVGPSGAAAQPPAGVRTLGTEVSALGGRSAFVTLGRRFRASRYGEASASFTPLQDLGGTITPADLHFERHHAGIPTVAPDTHELLVDGLVDRALIFTLADLARMPSVTRTLFLECSGNGRAKWEPAQPDADAQDLCGLTSCSEWTGVPLGRLLAEAGPASGGAWIVAEGGDACRMTRSIPLAKAMDDVVVALGQNGEPLRPAQGYPLRLVVPGWEGNISIKWLRRLHVVDRPYLTREETSKYTDLMPDGTARQFTFVMDAKSIIARPSGGQRLMQPGYHEISGLAWSGRGRVQRVDVSTDGGQTWSAATLDDPVRPFAHTRFHVDWRWTGSEAILASRCIDETGDEQPTRAQLVAVRGTRSSYHNNAIQAWRVRSDGRVENVDV